MKPQILKLVLVIVLIYLSYGARAGCMGSLASNQTIFSPTGCISRVLLGVDTGDDPCAGFYDNSHKIVLKLQDREITADITPPIDSNTGLGAILDMEDKFGETGCVTRSDIQQVRIEAGGDDGWLIESARTYIFGQPELGQVDLTKNYVLNRWVDGNQEETYSYNAKDLVLSLPDCISTVKVAATTGDIPLADSSSTHYLVLQLQKDSLEFALTGYKPKNEVYTKEFAVSDANELICLQKGDISQVRIEEGGNDGWYIADIKVESGRSEELAVNNPFNLWVEGDEEDEHTYNAKMLLLDMV